MSIDTSTSTCLKGTSNPSSNSTPFSNFNHSNTDTAITQNETTAQSSTNETTHHKLSDSFDDISTINTLTENETSDLSVHKDNSSTSARNKKSDIVVVSVKDLISKFDSSDTQNLSTGSSTTDATTNSTNKTLQQFFNSKPQSTTPSNFTLQASTGIQSTTTFSSNPTTSLSTSTITSTDNLTSKNRTDSTETLTTSTIKEKSSCDTTTNFSNKNTENQSPTFKAQSNSSLSSFNVMDHLKYLRSDKSIEGLEGVLQSSPQVSTCDHSTQDHASKITPASSSQSISHTPTHTSMPEQSNCRSETNSSETERCFLKSRESSSVTIRSEKSKEQRELTRSAIENIKLSNNELLKIVFDDMISSDDAFRSLGNKNEFVQNMFCLTNGNLLVHFRPSLTNDYHNSDHRDKLAIYNSEFIEKISTKIKDIKSLTVVDCTNPMNTNQKYELIYTKMSHTSSTIYCYSLEDLRFKGNIKHDINQFLIEPLQCTKEPAQISSNECTLGDCAICKGNEFNKRLESNTLMYFKAGILLIGCNKRISIHYCDKLWHKKSCDIYTDQCFKDLKLFANGVAVTTIDKMLIYSYDGQQLYKIENISKFSYFGVLIDKSLRECLFLINHNTIHVIDDQLMEIYKETTPTYITKPYECCFGKIIRFHDRCLIANQNMNGLFCY